MAALALAIAACDQVPQRMDPPAPTPAPPVAKPPVATPRPTPTPPPAVNVRTLDEYKRVVATRVREANSDRTHRGQLQPLLRAVVVLEFKVDRNGGIQNVRTLRAPEREAESIASASLRRAGPLPAPPAHILRGGLAQITETWLFQDNGHFQLRTLAEGQLGAR
jgi:protein TonB